MKVTMIIADEDMLKIKNKMVETFGKGISLTFESNGEAVEPSKWISVKDRLPKDKKPVFVYTKSTARSGNNTTTAICDQGFWFLKGSEDSYCFPIHQKIVTHWQPLPKPPKENEK